MIWTLPDTTPRTQADLAALDLLRAPLWIFDLDAGVKWWANRRGLALWNVGSNEELRARNPRPEMSEAMRIRLDALRQRLARGEHPVERWTLYPTGQRPFLAELSLSGIVIADAAGAPPRLAMLSEARPLGDDDVDPFVRRGVEALRYLDEMVSLYARSGALLMRNPAAIAALGDVADAPKGVDAFASIFADAHVAADVRQALIAGPFRGDALVRTRAGVAWHDVCARESKDPISGEMSVLVTQRDITEKVEIRERLAAQAEELRRLAASPLRVWPGILALPLIGRIDDARIRAALANLQREAAQGRVDVVLLDLTGAEDVDAEAAAAIRGLIGVLALQGIGARVVGIRAALAMTMVEAGLDFGATPVHASLADALARTFRDRR